MPYDDVSVKTRWNSGGVATTPRKVKKADPPVTSPMRPLGASRVSSARNTPFHPTAVAPSAVAKANIAHSGHAGVAASAARALSPMPTPRSPSVVRRLKADVRHDITVDGPELAAHALRAGLVDELHMIVCPGVVGAGKRFFPDRVRLTLESVDERRFSRGVVVLRYAVRD